MSVSHTRRFLAGQQYFSVDRVRFFVTVSCRLADAAHVRRVDRIVVDGALGDTLAAQQEGAMGALDAVLDLAPGSVHAGAAIGHRACARHPGHCWYATCASERRGAHAVGIATAIRHHGGRARCRASSVVEIRVPEAPEK